MNAEVVEKVVNEIAEFNQFEANLTEFKKQYEGIVYDLNDPAQDKQARSDRLSVGRVISLLDKTHKELKAPLKAKTDLIDHERKRIKDDLLGVQLLIKSQIEKHEKEISDKAEKLQDMVEELEVLPEFDPSYEYNSEAIQQRIKIANKIKIDDSYEHRKADALLAKTESIERLESLLETQLNIESEQAELQRLRDEEAARLQAEREELIRKEAAEKARLEAEQKAENDRVEAENKAKAEIEAAEKAAQKKIDDADEAKKKAIDDANREKLEAENAKKQQEAETKRRETLAANQERERIEAEQAEAKRKQDEADKKEVAKKAKQAHRSKIHKAAKESFMAQGIVESDATDLVNAIKDGKIANVELVY